MYQTPQFSPNHFSNLRRNRNQKKNNFLHHQLIPYILVHIHPRPKELQKYRKLNILHSPFNRLPKNFATPQYSPPTNNSRTPPLLYPPAPHLSIPVYIEDPPTRDKCHANATGPLTSPKFLPGSAGTFESSFLRCLAALKCIRARMNVITAANIPTKATRNDGQNFVYRQLSRG